MDIKYKRQLLEVGMDLNSVLDRFMNNEGLYEKFLVKFLEDSNFFELMKNIEAGNYEEAFFNAHTLKGVSANLGLTSIHNPLVSIVDELRDNKINVSSEALKTLQTNYKELCNIIKENSNVMLMKS